MGGRERENHRIALRKRSRHRNQSAQRGGLNGTGGPDPTAQIGAWVRALRLYGDLGDLELLLPESLFDQDLTRQRAPRRKP